MALTRQQIQENINSLEQQGASEDDINEYLSNLQTQKIQEPIKKEQGKVTGFGLGVAKSIGESALDLYKTAGFLTKINPLSNRIKEQVKKTDLGKKIISKGEEIEQKLITRAEKIIEPKTTAEKVGKIAGTIGQIATPTGLGTNAYLTTTKTARQLSTAKKILSLSPKELKKISGTGLEFLKEKSLRKLPIKGGGFKTAEYSMPQQIEKLSSEFKDIISSNLEKTRKNAEKLISNYGKKTLNLFSDNNPSINLNKLKISLKNAIKKDTSTIYGSEFNEIADKAIKVFTSKVKSETAKGLEDARLAWRFEKKKATGKLSNANEAIHKVLKNTIKELLPEEKRKLYDVYKQKQAKLFDIQDIIDAKKAAKIGTSKLKKAGKVLGAGLGVYGIMEGAKKLLK